jgi:hypothetical protein
MAIITAVSMGGCSWARPFFVNSRLSFSLWRSDGSSFIAAQVGFVDFNLQV